MENNVVTLETAKKFKVAGFPQETETLVWVNAEGDWQLTTVYLASSSHAGILETLAAPTAQEIADQLPMFTLYRNGPKAEAVYLVACDDQAAENFDEVGKADTMAEALALLYLKLHASPATPNQSDGGESHDIS